MSELQTSFGKRQFIRANLTILTLWSLFGFAEGNATFYSMRTHGHSYWLIVLWCNLCWVGCALLTPTLLLIGGRFPLERFRLIRSVPIHLLAFCGFVLCQSVWTIWLSQLMKPYRPMAVELIPWSSFVDWTIGQLPISVFAYGTVVMVGYAFDYRNRFAREAEQKAELETLLTKTELSVLKSQMQPHFLFNTLNAILSLVRKEDKESAESTLLNLSCMLRYSLDRGGVQFSPLSEEIEFLNMYLAIEQVRFSDRLSVSFDIPADTLAAQVPSLILQPLVENSIRHGLAPKAVPVHIDIRAEIVGPRLILQVVDNGAGLSGMKPASGLGISNITARLQHLFGDDQSFELQARPDGQGVQVILSIPYKSSEVGVS